MTDEYKFGTWYPIESAPKDPTLYVLVARMGDVVVERASYSYHNDNNSTFPEYRIAHANNQLEYIHLNYCHPTHWMPLPSPPEEK